MYHLIVRSKLRRAFAAINRGDYSAVVAQFAPRHRHLRHASSGTNVGVHEFVLRWGRVHRLAVHCDTARLAAYCQQMAQCGLAEAMAAPITDVPWTESRT